MNLTLLLLCSALLSGPKAHKNDYSATAKIMHKGPSVKYKLRFKNKRSLVRYADRNEQQSVKQDLNDKYKPGVSSTGIKLRKRTQNLMNDLDPNTPIAKHIDKKNKPIGTKGYHSQALVNFKGLRSGDTILVVYNKGLGSSRILKEYIVNKASIDIYGRKILSLPLGNDNTTSSIFGVMVKFGSFNRSDRFDRGTVSYNIRIHREVHIPGGSSAKPLTKRRAKRR